MSLSHLGRGAKHGREETQVDPRILQNRDAIRNRKMGIASSCKSPRNEMLKPESAAVDFETSMVWITHVDFLTISPGNASLRTSFQLSRFARPQNNKLGWQETCPASGRREQRAVPTRASFQGPYRGRGQRVVGAPI